MELIPLVLRVNEFGWKTAQCVPLHIEGVKF
jgi:hypothetical protein